MLSKTYNLPFSACIYLNRGARGNNEGSDNLLNIKASSLSGCVEFNVVDVVVLDVEEVLVEAVQAVTGVRRR